MSFTYFYFYSFILVQSNYNFSIYFYGKNKCDMVKYWLQPRNFCFHSVTFIRFDGCLSASKCYPYKAWRRNLSGISPTRNVAFMNARTYAKAFLSLNRDKNFALYWCFCLKISFILLLTKWSEIGERSRCEATDLSWDLSPSVLQF